MALEETGFLDMLVPGAVVAVEWADRFPEALPRDRMELQIEREAVAERIEQRIRSALHSAGASYASIQQTRAAAQRERQTA